MLTELRGIQWKGTRTTSDERVFNRTIPAEPTHRADRMGVGAVEKRENFRSAACRVKSVFPRYLTVYISRYLK